MKKGWDWGLNNKTRPHRNYFVGSSASTTLLDIFTSIVLQVARAECIPATNETAQRMTNMYSGMVVSHFFLSVEYLQNQKRPCSVGKAVNMHTAGQEVGCVNNIAERW